MKWQWKEGKRTYTWFGKFMRDYPLPEGFTADELGTCDHEIEIPGCRYTIGVKEKGGKIHLLFDFWKSGGLDKALGSDGGKLKQAYMLAKTIMTVKAMGKNFAVRELENGDKQVVIAA
jgi:hypothetical protein